MKCKQQLYSVSRPINGAQGIEDNNKIVQIQYT